MKATTTLILCAMFFTTTAFAEMTTNGIAGKYKCQRSDDSSNTSSYPLTISKTGDTYTLEWTDGEGNPVMYGTGIIHPDMTNVLTSSYWNIANTDNGVESFTITEDGDLKANWLAQSGKNSGTENCIKS